MLKIKYVSQPIDKVQYDCTLDGNVHYVYEYVMFLVSQVKTLLTRNILQIFWQGHSLSSKKLNWNKRKKETERKLMTAKSDFQMYVELKRRKIRSEEEKQFENSRRLKSFQIIREEQISHPPGLNWF